MMLAFCRVQCLLGQGWLGVYALLILLVLISVTMALVVCPGGLVLALAGCMLYLTLFLVVALGVSGALVVAQDTCWSSERLVVAEVCVTFTVHHIIALATLLALTAALNTACQVSAPTVKALLSYYLLPNNSTMTLSSVLTQAQIVDINQV